MKTQISLCLWAVLLVFAGCPNGSQGINAYTQADCEECYDAQADLERLNDSGEMSNF